MPSPALNRTLPASGRKAWVIRQPAVPVAHCLFDPGIAPHLNDAERDLLRLISILSG